MAARKIGSGIRWNFYFLIIGTGCAKFGASCLHVLAARLMACHLEECRKYLDLRWAVLYLVGRIEL